MEQKRVTFKVAKVFRAVGYPQSEEKRMIFSYFTGIHRYISNNVDCSSELENELIEPINWVDSYNYEAHDFDGDFIDAPTYLDVWLWLWRKKNIQIRNEFNSAYIWPIGIAIYDYSDPEEAIIAAIDYLVENNLIK